MIALAFDLAIAWVLYRIGKRRGEKEGQHVVLAPLVSEEDHSPSLARLQLLLWTFVGIFSFLTVLFVRLLSGVQVSVVLPQNTLTLIGINAGTPVVSSAISRSTYKDDIRYVSWIRDGGGTVEFLPLSTLLDENKTFSATRFQQLAWTFVSIIIFLSTLAVQLSNLPEDLSKLDIPDVSTTLVVLSGISQGAYLAGKGASE